ncbi:MAG: serine hydrolase domain-containing protein [Pseudomonadota bacterium]
MRVFAFLFISCAIVSHSMAETVQGPDTIVSSKLNQQFERYRSEEKPGVAVRVLHQGSVVFDNEYGMANLSDGVPISEETVFNIGSVSKQFTVFAALLLEQRGELALTDDIRKYIPELTRVDTPITLEQLARHTSGLKSPNFLALVGGWRQPDMRDHAQMLELVLRQEALEFRPGTNYKYTNAGTLLLAEVIARVCECRFAQFMAQEVFEPLGMNSTFVRDDITTVIKNEAHGYFEEEGQVRFAVNPIAHFGFSNIYSTPSDMERWARNFWDPVLGGRTVVDKMLSPTVLANGQPVDHMMGLFLSPTRGVLHYQHTGSHRAYLSYFGLFPQSQSAIIMLSNNAAFDLFANADQISETLFPADEPQQSDIDDAIVEVEFDYSDMKSVVGTYWSKKNKILREIQVSDDSLIYVRGEGNTSTFKATAAGQFRIEEPGVAFSISFENGNLLIDYEGEKDRMHRITPGNDREGKDYQGTYVSHELGQVFDVVVCDGILQIDSIKRDPVLLTKSHSDVFKTDTWFLSTVEFKHDDELGIIGFYGSNVNVIDIWFDRVEEVGTHRSGYLQRSACGIEKA